MDRLTLINRALLLLSIRSVRTTDDPHGIGGACLVHFNTVWSEITTMNREMLRETYTPVGGDWIESILSVPNRWSEIDEVYFKQAGVYPIRLTPISRDAYEQFRASIGLSFVQPYYYTIETPSRLLFYPDLQPEQRTEILVSAFRNPTPPLTDTSFFDNGVLFDDVVVYGIAAKVATYYLADPVKARGFAEEYRLKTLQFTAKTSTTAHGRGNKLRVPGGRQWR